MVRAALSLGGRPHKPADWDSVRRPASVLADFFGYYFKYASKRERNIAVSKIERMLEGGGGIDQLSEDCIWGTIEAMSEAYQEALSRPDLVFDRPYSVGFIPYCAAKLRDGKSLCKRVRVSGVHLLEVAGGEIVREAPRVNILA